MKEKKFLACCHCWWKNPEASENSKRVCGKPPCKGAGECVGVVYACCFDCPLGLADCAFDRCRQARVMHRAGLEARPLTEAERARHAAMTRTWEEKAADKAIERRQPGSRNTPSTRRKSAH